MGDVDRERLRALVDAATPGPWEHYGDMLVWPSMKGPAANDPVLAMVGEAHTDSAEFIAAARAAVPQLLDALDAAEAEVRALRTKLAWQGVVGDE